MTRNMPSFTLCMGMVTFQLDPSTNCGTRFHDVDIVDNVFVYDIDSTTGHCAIKLGTGDSSAKTKGNVFERFRIEGNRIYRSPRAKLKESFKAFIWYNCWAGEDRLNALYVAMTRAVESLWILSKEKGSWFEPLGLVPGESGMLVQTPPRPREKTALPSLIYHAKRFGRQEESLSPPKEAAHDYAAVQFGLALHYTLEMMGSFTNSALCSALESARNRYGAVLHEGAIGEIEARVRRLIADPTFMMLCEGEWRKEQMIRHKGSIGVIDLLVQTNEGWNVIDYKSGREEEQKHRKQVERYAEAVATLGGGRASGYLCYLLEDRIEWVKCL